MITDYLHNEELSFCYLIPISKILLFILLFFLIFFPPNIYPAEDRFPYETLKVTGVFSSTYVGRYLYYYEDADGSVTLDEFREMEIDDGLVESQSKAPGFGYTGSTYWLRFSVENETDNLKPLVLVIENPLVDRVKLFFPRNGDYFAMKGGDHIPFENRDIPYRNVVFPVDVKPGINTYYMRVATSSNMNLPLQLMTEEAFTEDKNTELVLLWIFYGILISMVVYNLLIFLSSRDLAYLYYILAIGGFLIFRMAYNGLAFQYLWPNNIWWANHCVPFSISFFALFLVQFTRTFLGTRKQLRRFDWILISLIALFSAGMVISLTGMYRFAIKYVLSVSFVTVIMLVIAGIRALGKGSREAIFFLVSWTLFLVGSALNILRDFGYLPVHFITTWGQQVGGAAQVLLLSLGLADRINTLRRKITDTNLELVRANELIESERELLSVTLRSIGDAVITADLDGTILLMNEKAEEMTGWKKGQTHNAHLQDVFTVCREGSEEPETIPVQGCIESGTVTEIDSQIVLVPREGERKNIAYSIAPVRDHHNNPMGIVLVFRDITERLRIEKEMLKSSKLESLGTFAGGIAHDFNNILTVIIGSLSLMKIEAGENESLVEIVEDTETITHRARDLTQQLLTFSRGGEPIKKRSDLKSLLMETSSFILSGSRIGISYDIEEDLWTVEIDEGQISQAFNNIIINAMQAMPRGGEIQVTARNIVVDGSGQVPLEHGSYVGVTIIDHGSGIPEDVLPRIFDPFFTTKNEGSGIGLASTYSIIKKHGGQIFVDSRVGEGTVFMVYLPSLGKRIEIEPNHKKTLRRGRGRVLVMDDEEMVLKTACKLIDNLGYEAVPTMDGSEAINEYQTALNEDRPFDAVIMDLTIPGGMGGIDAVKEIHAIDQNARVIVSSGYSNDPVMANYLKYGFMDVIVKPYTISAVSDVLYRVIKDDD